MDWEIPDKIEKNLDEAIDELKKLKSEIPNNLYNLSSKDEFVIRRILAIIEGMNIPLLIKTED